MLWFTIQFIAGLFLGLFINAQIFLSLLYTLPRAVAGVGRGELKSTAIFSPLITVFIWVFVLLVAGAISAMLLPSVLIFVSSNGFAYGEILSLVLLFFNSVNAKGRADLDEEFTKTMARFRKENLSM